MMRGFQLQWEGNKSPQGAYLIGHGDTRWNIRGFQHGVIHTDKGIVPSGSYMRTIEFGQTQGGRVLMEIKDGPMSHPQQVIATKAVSKNLQEVFIEVPDHFVLFDANGNRCKEFATLNELERLASES